MGTLQNLQDLVQNLEKSEKRYFRLLQTGTGKSDSQVLQLFDWMQSRDPGDPIDPSLNGEAVSGLAANLPTLTRRLTQGILTALRTQHAGQSVESRLNLALEDISLLYRRKQWEMALWVIRKEKRIALRFSYLPQYLSILGYERQLVLAMFPQDSMSRMRECRREESEALALLMPQSELNHLHFLSRNLLRHAQQAGQDPENREFYEIAHHPVVEAGLSSADFLSFSFASAIRGSYFNYKQDFQASIPIFRRLMAEWLDSPEWVKERPQLFLILFSNYQIAVLRGQMDTSELEECLLFIRKLKLSDPATKLNFENVSYQSELVIRINTGRFEEAALLSAEIDHWLVQNSTRLSGNVHLAFLYNALVTHFMREDFVKAGRCLVKILSHPSKDARKEIRDFARLLQVCIAYDSGDETYADYLLQSAYQYFLRREYSQLYRETVEYVRRQMRLPPGKERIAVLEEYLASIREIAENPAENTPFGLMELRIWADARWRGVSLRQAFNELREVE